MFKATFRIKMYLPNKKFFLAFLDFEQHLFGLLTRSFCAIFSQPQLRVHSNVFIKNIFFEKGIFSKSSSVFTRSFSCFGPKIYGRVDKKAFFMSEGYFMEKTHFEKNKIYLTFTDFVRIAFEIWHEASAELPKFHILC